MEDVKDVNIFGFMVVGLLLIGAGIVLVRLAIKSPLGLPVMIEALGRAVRTQTLPVCQRIDFKIILLTFTSPTCFSANIFN